MTAKFITLDGIDGSGKTTQLNVMKQWFEQNNLPVVFTREPGGTAFGEALREIVLKVGNQIDPRAETLLMFAARQQHLVDVILPNLNKGINVVSDRFTDATFAYQGGGKGLPETDIDTLQTWVQGSLRPDLTILLDVSLETAMQRIEGAREKDRFEQEDSAFFTRVRDTYLRRAAAQPEAYAIVDSSRDKDWTKNQIEMALNQLFK